MKMTVVSPESVPIRLNSFFCVMGGCSLYRKNYKYWDMYV